MQTPFLINTATHVKSIRTIIRQTGLLWISLLLAQHSFAQFSGGGPSPGGKPNPSSIEEMAQRETKWMKRKLKMTEQQLGSVSELNREYASRRTEHVQMLMKDGELLNPLALSEMQTKIDALQIEKEQKLKVLLTERQWAVYQKKKKNITPNTDMARPPMSGAFGQLGSGGTH